MHCVGFNTSEGGYIVWWSWCTNAL